MFSSKKKPPMGNLSVLLPQVNVEGNVITNGPMHINNHIKGSVTGKGDNSHILIGKQGKVIGDVVAIDLDIYGAVVGDVKCRNLTIRANALIQGNISYQTIEMEQNARIDGGMYNVSSQQAVNNQAQVTQNNKG